jgi:hypothetical protein
MWVLCNINNQNQINNTTNFFVQHHYSTFTHVLLWPIHSNVLNQTLALVFLVIWSCTTQHHHHEHHPYLWANKAMVVLTLVIFCKLKQQDFTFLHKALKEPFKTTTTIGNKPIKSWPKLLNTTNYLRPQHSCTSPKTLKGYLAFT